ncbi:MAG: prolipoprotein diacylglyceryl transferase [Candidatus Omnitrophica bacterium]|nr:prolipoprotein diacylglyceryl transferase [Candidatus Omnitrophota bacterium]
MKPILFSFGTFHLYSFGVMILIGLLISLALMKRRALADGFPKKDDSADLVFVIVVFGFLGARLFYVFQNISWYLENPLRVFAIWEGGLIFYGGLIGSLAALFFAMRLKNIPYFRGLDFLLPYVALTQAFGRLGCFLNGCCSGSICHYSWCVLFPGTAETVHPAQLYEAAYDFLLFLFLNRFYSKKQFDGQVSAFYFMFYGAGRFAVEYFRAGNPTWLFFTYNQWFSLFLIIAALGFYGNHYFRKR